MIEETELMVFIIRIKKVPTVVLICLTLTRILSWMTHKHVEKKEILNLNQLIYYL